MKRKKREIKPLLNVLSNKWKWKKHKVKEDKGVIIPIPEEQIETEFENLKDIRCIGRVEEVVTTFMRYINMLKDEYEINYKETPNMIIVNSEVYALFTIYWRAYVKDNVKVNKLFDMKLIVVEHSEIQVFKEVKIHEN